MQAENRSNVVLGVCGSIAAYKAVEIARKLIKRGYQVRVVMTESAKNFIGAATFEAITGNKVIDDLWSTRDGSIEHIELADWADVFLIAPATADTLSKMVSGVAENALLASVLATQAQVLVAPAMNVNMYNHPATQANLATLISRGVQIIAPDCGELACGWNDLGRLADPWEIYYETMRALTPADLAGKRILITTGPTREDIDPVRFVSNRSSGKMGVALAKEAFLRGADVTLIHGPVFTKVPRVVKKIGITSAASLYETLMKQAFEVPQKPDIVIMAAAVADYRPDQTAEHKIKRTATGMELDLVANPDIIKDVSTRRGAIRNPILVGFAVETGEPEDLIAEINRKLHAKGVDLIVGNLAQEALDRDTNHVWLVDRTGSQDEILTTYKSRVSRKIFDAIKKLS